LFTSDAEIEHLGERFLARELPKEEWTHEAHLATTTWLLLRRPDIDVDKELPGLIRAYNESVGGVNSDSEGYHDTITRVNFAGVRLFLEPVDGRVTDFVSARLSWPTAIAVDFARDLQRVGAIALDEEVDPLLARPAFCMEAGVDHQSAAAEGYRLQVAKAECRFSIIDSKLIDQLLGVQRPAFRVRIEGEQGADEWQLVRIFALPDVAGDGLVRGKVGQAVLAVQVGDAEVDPELAGDLAVYRPGTAIGCRRAGFLLGRHALHFQMARHHCVERAGKDGADLRQPLL